MKKRISVRKRAEQLRAAKRAQRERERHAGLVAFALRLPRIQALRLRVAAAAPHFGRNLDAFLRDAVLDIDEWPKLRELAWNRAGPWIAAEDALALYERNWRFVDPADLTREEADLVERLKSRHGAGLLNA